MSEELLGNSFDSEELLGNSFDSLEQTLPSLIVYLSTGPSSDLGRGPTPVEGWNFKFEPWILEVLIEGLFEEEDWRLDSAEKHKIRLLLDRENIPPEEVSQFEAFVHTTELVHQAILLATKWL